MGLSGPNDAIYFSDDGGDSWTGLGLNNQGGADVAVAPGNSNTIYTSWAGVRKSVDEGQTWTWLSQGITGVSPRRIVVSPHDPERLLVVADADGAFGTHDMGNTWLTYPISNTGESHQYGAAAFDSSVPMSPMSEEQIGCLEQWMMGGVGKLQPTCPWQNCRPPMTWFGPYP